MITKRTYYTENFIFFNMKKLSYIISITCILYLSLSINSISFCGPLSGMGETWACITTPFTSYIGDLKPSRFNVGPIHKKTYWLNIPRIYTETEGNFFQREDFYNNGIIRLLTFWNNEVIGSLSMAAGLGDFQIPYYIFFHGSNDSVYIAKGLTAPGVLLYGYSWIINIPAKFLTTWDSLINQSNKIGLFTLGDKVLMTIDLIWSCIITIFIELPLAIINTILGFFIALFYHPFDSILAIPGCIYYGVLSTVNAIWGILANIIMIPIHVLF